MRVYLFHLDISYMYLINILYSFLLKIKTYLEKYNNKNNKKLF